MRRPDIGSDSLSLYLGVTKTEFHNKKNKKTIKIRECYSYRRLEYGKQKTHTEHTGKISQQVGPNWFLSEFMVKVCHNSSN